MTHNLIETNKWTLTIGKFLLLFPSSWVNPLHSSPLSVWALVPHPHFLHSPPHSYFLVPLRPLFSLPICPSPLIPLPVWALTPEPHFLCEFSPSHSHLPLTPRPYFLFEPSALIPTSCLSPQPSFPLPAWVLLSHPHHLCKPSPLIHTCLPLYPLSPLASCSHWLVNEKWILTDLCECMSWGSGKDKARCHILFLPKHWLIQISDHEAEWVSHSMVAQSDAVDLYLIDREISLDIIIFFFQVVSKNPSMQKKKSILNDMLFITRASFTKVLWFISACNL